MPEPDWRPIETAPRDGTRFIAWIEPERGDRKYATIIQWHQGHWRDDELYPWYASEVRHWLPLPTPPKEQNDGQ